MPIAPNFTSIASKEWEINFLQCYPNGYLKYTDLCNLLQLTAAFHAEQGGISFTDMQINHQAWVLSRMRVEITEMPKWRDIVTVKTWINSLENSRSVRCLEMFLGEKKIIGCETFWSVFNTNTRRPAPLALPFEHFKIFQDRATLYPVSKIDILHDMDPITTHTVKLSDLDIVNHANSVKYLEWCLDFVNTDTIENQKVASLEMNYLKELSLDDNVIIKKIELDNSITFAIVKGDKSSFALQMQLK